MNLILGLFTFILVLISVFMVLVILAQRAKSDGGVGAALGGGMTEAAFGAESGNVLSRATTYAAVAFFVIAFGLYLGYLHLHRTAQAESPAGLPTSPELTVPAGGQGADATMPLDIPTINFPVPAESDAEAAASESAGEPSARSNAVETEGNAPATSTEP